MSLGGGSKSKSTSKPLTPDEVTGYFTQLDRLTGAGTPERTEQVITGYSRNPNPWAGQFGADDGYGRTPQPIYETRVIPATGGPGRLGTFAKEGTRETQYNGPGNAARVSAQPLTSRDVTAREVGFNPLTPEQIRALGGAGATRELALDRARETSSEELASDPRLSTYQRLRGRQLTDRDIRAERDAINAEVEALMTGLAEGQQERRLETETGNAQRVLTADTGSADRALLAGRSNQDASLRADLANQDLFLEEARRQYEANRNNAQLTREDLQALAGIYFGGTGQTQTQSQKQNNGLGGLLSVGLAL